MGDNREAFERAAKAHLWQPGPFLRDCNDIDATRIYELTEIEDAWNMWKAATAAAEEKYLKVINELRLVLSIIQLYTVPDPTKSVPLHIVYDLSVIERVADAALKFAASSLGEK